MNQEDNCETSCCINGALIPLGQHNHQKDVSMLSHQLAGSICVVPLRIEPAMTALIALYDGENDVIIAADGMQTKKSQSTGAKAPGENKAVKIAPLGVDCCLGNVGAVVDANLLFSEAFGLPKLSDDSTDYIHEIGAGLRGFPETSFSKAMSAIDEAMPVVVEQIKKRRLDQRSTSFVLVGRDIGGKASIVHWKSEEDWKKSRTLHPARYGAAPIGELTPSDIGVLRGKMANLDQDPMDLLRDVFSFCAYAVPDAANMHVNYARLRDEFVVAPLMLSCSATQDS